MDHILMQVHLYVNTCSLNIAPHVFLISDLMETSQDGVLALKAKVLKRQI